MVDLQITFRTPDSLRPEAQELFIETVKALAAGMQMDVVAVETVTEEVVQRNADRELFSDVNAHRYSPSVGERVWNALSRYLGDSDLDHRIASTSPIESERAHRFKQAMQLANRDLPRTVFIPQSVIEEIVEGCTTTGDSAMRIDDLGQISVQFLGDVLKALRAQDTKS